VKAHWKEFVTRDLEKIERALQETIGHSIP
jgi:hypothetical protein